MKHNRVILIAIGAVIILAVASLVFLRQWDKREIIGTIERVQPPVCTMNIANSSCGDGVVAVRTEDGAVKDYEYPSDGLEPREFSVASLQKGAKMKLVVSHGKITHIEHAE